MNKPLHSPEAKGMNAVAKAGQGAAWAGSGMLVAPEALPSEAKLTLTLVSSPSYSLRKPGP